MRKLCVTAALAVPVLLVTACGSSATTDAAPTAKPSTASTTKAPAAKPTTKAPTKAAQACEQPSADLVAGIMKGEESGAGLKATKAGAWRSPDYSKVYFVAVRFAADGVGEQTGVWATNALEAGGGSILAVDGTAKSFTVWPDADNTAAHIDGADPGVKKAKGCLS